MKERIKRLVMGPAAVLCVLGLGSGAGVRMVAAYGLWEGLQLLKCICRVERLLEGCDFESSRESSGIEEMAGAFERRQKEELVLRGVESECMVLEVKLLLFTR